MIISCQNKIQSEPKEEFQIYFRLHNGNGCCFTTSPLQTIDGLTTRLRNSNLELPQIFRLVYCGKHLKDPMCTLTDLSIKNKGIIHIDHNVPTSLKQMKIDVCIYFNGDKLIVRVKTHETIYNLKQKLYRLLHILPKNQLLIFRGVKLHNEQLLEHYHIKTDSLLCLHAEQIDDRTNCENQDGDIEGLPKNSELIQSALSLNLKHSAEENIRLFRSDNWTGRDLIQDQPIYQVQIHHDNKQDLDDENQLTKGRQFNFQLFKPSPMISILQSTKRKQQKLDSLSNQEMQDPWQLNIDARSQNMFLGEFADGISMSLKMI